MVQRASKVDVEGGTVESLALYLAKPKKVLKSKHFSVPYYHLRGLLSLIPLLKVLPFFKVLQYSGLYVFSINRSPGT